jgi:hypothetical protein
MANLIVSKSEIRSELLLSAGLNNAHSESASYYYNLV